MGLLSDLHSNQYDTLVEALQDLQKRGYTASFQIHNYIAFCIQSKKTYQSQDLSIIEYHRFEGDTGPQDMSIVYVVECKDGTKGTIIDAYGTYSDTEMSEFLKNVTMA
ncbi:phosphoribosylpyrophosphate synthetase [Candidatus Marinamargulisbacteria bacterium SCGC AG-439-L15]|nr:phosphoribosylpyrophosphate synthetase [Candidatus Marinamargulisbacteria bacterium SCGC AG-439-L15]